MCIFLNSVRQVHCTHQTRRAMTVVRRSVSVQWVCFSNADPLRLMGEVQFTGLVEALRGPIIFPH